jgi:hypothetical protein
MSCAGEAAADTGLAVDEVIIIAIIITLKLNKNTEQCLCFKFMSLWSIYNLFIMRALYYKLFLLF